MMGGAALPVALASRFCRPCAARDYCWALGCHLNMVQCGTLRRGVAARITCTDYNDVETWNAKRQHEGEQHGEPQASATQGSPAMTSHA